MISINNTTYQLPYADLLRPLTETEYNELRADIEANGITYSVIIDEDNNVIDGQHRLQIAAGLGVTDIPFQILPGLSEEEKREKALNLNLHRRHLSVEDRKGMALKMRQNGHSYRAIGEKLGVSDVTVMNDIESGAKNLAPHTDSGIVLPSKIKGKDGKIYPARIRTRNQDEANKAQKILQSARQLPEGDLTLADIDNSKAPPNMAQPMQVMLSHESVDYYTPSKYIEAARQVMAQIDLDPASCEAAQETVKAKHFYSESDDGLSQEWHGHIWLNPPYSKTNGKSNQELWAQKLVSEYQAGNVKQGILLVKSALGYRWFEELWDLMPACFIRERLSFTKSNGSSDGESKHGTTIFYLGNNLSGFVEIFSGFGRITIPDGRYISQRS